MPNIEALGLAISEKNFSCISHYKPMADNDTAWAGTVWTPGAWLVRFIKRTTIQSYTQNMKSGPCDFGGEDFLCFFFFFFFFFFFSFTSVGANGPQGGAIFDPRAMTSRIYVKLHITMRIFVFESVN